MHTWWRRLLRGVVGYSDTDPAPCENGCGAIVGPNRGERRSRQVFCSVECKDEHFNSLQW